jgi:predicted GH43/DUF377 family glycosyl hydrolase
MMYRLSTLRAAMLPIMAAVAAAAAEPARAIPGWGAWSKRPEPVLQGQYGIAGDPCVLRVGPTLRMVYGAFDPAKRPQGPATCVAESPDGLVWKELDTGEPLVRGRVLRPGTGMWEDTHETPCWLRREDGTWMMWFIGYRDRGGWLASAPASIGLALSRDGRTFAAPAPEPVLRPTADGPDGFSITAPSVVRDGRGYRMVYAGWGRTDGQLLRGRLLMATSSDGRRWTKSSRPVLDEHALPAFCDEHLAEPDLVRAPDGTWALLFTATHAHGRHEIGIATAPAPDGPWRICPQPVITPSAGGFDAKEVVAPDALIEDGRIRVWYAGFAADGKRIAIGHAEAPWPLGR